MQTSPEGLMALIGREAICQSRYFDSVMVPSIGVGHTAAAGPPDPKNFVGIMPLAEVFDLFRKDILKYEALVNEAIRVEVEQHEYDALVSFVYNVGHLAGTSVAAELNAGDTHAAGNAFLNFAKPAVLHDRRMGERDQFLLGVYPQPFATVYPASPAGVIQWAHGKRIDLRPYFGGTGEEKPVPASIHHPVLARGAAGPDVLALQNALKAKGISPLTVDGSFGGETERAVKAFQATHALTVDGVAGKQTWQALGV